MKIGFIGGGRMCVSFCQYLRGCPVSITGVLTKDILYTNFAQRVINIDVLTPFLQECDIVFLTVKDDGIRPLAQDIAQSGVTIDGCVFCHMSGSLSSDALSPLQGSRGLCAFHTMTSLTGGPVDFSKVICTLQGTGAGEEALKEFSSIANLTVISIKKEDKLLYHAASCFCANFILPLIDTAKNIYCDIGFSESDAYALMLPLLSQVLENLKQNGTAKALTGPFSRGDCETVRKHIADLEKREPAYAGLYRNMGRLTAAFSAENGIISAEKKDELDKILK